MATDLADLPPICLSGKRGYGSAAQATAAKAKIARPLSGKGGKKPRRAYFCKLCNQWHLTARTGKGSPR